MATREQLLAQAIRHRHRVRLAYRRDGGRGLRVGQPHILYTAATGRLLVDLWQESGFTSRGRLPVWSALDVEQISEVEVLDTGFRPRPDFNPANARYVRVHASAEPAAAEGR